MPPLITLTSDLGLKDNYAALVKAALLKAVPGVDIVDITHDIEKFNLIHAAYIFDNTYRYFPGSSYHLVGIKGKHAAKRLLYCELNDQKIICPDNGFITLLRDTEKAKVFSLEGEKFSPGIFFLRDAMVAALTALIHPNADALAPCRDYEQLIPFLPGATPQTISGRCIHVDSFGNVITNITQEFFERERKGRKFIINLPGLEIDEIRNDYDEVGADTALALFNSFGYLEIAINRENASRLLFSRSNNPNADFGIIIEFED